MRPTIDRAEQVTSPFIGRRHERQRLEAALVDALAGRGRVVMLVGEPGIGKTRTAEYLAAAARSANAEVLLGRCYEGAGAPVYWPWRQLARTYIRGASPANLAEDLGAGAGDVARVVEELHQVLPNLTELPPAIEPDEARFRLFDAVTRFLCAAARRRPLVLILDDLHWADLASLHLLQFFARGLAEAPVLVVGTYRDVEVRAEQAKSEVLGSLSRERLYERLPLIGLSEDDTGALLEALVGAPPTDGLVHALHEHTAGNPFLLTEIARHLEEQRQHRSGDLTSLGERVLIPESLRSMVRQRAKPLSPQALDLLDVAAVVGHEVEFAAMASILAVDRESILPLVEEAVQAGILQPLATLSPRVRFVHALVRDVLYDGISAARRASLHRRVGLGLERIRPFAREEHTAELALHFLASATTSDAQRGVDYAVLAAERAMAQFAYDEATQWYRRAIEALAQEPEVDLARLCRLLLALGGAQAAASNIAEMRDTFRRAANLARRLGDAAALAEAAIGFARVPIAEGTVEPVTIALLEEALATLPKAASKLRAEALSMLAYSLQHAPGSQERRVALCREAARSAQRIGDLRTLARIRYDQHRSLIGPDTLDGRVEAAEELLRFAQQTDDRAMLFRARFCRVIDWLEMGRLAPCDAEIDALDQIAAELREPWHHWNTAFFRATRATMSGHFDAAEALAHDAFRYGERVAPELALQVLGVQVSMLRALQGRWAEMTPAIRDLVAQAPAIAAWRCTLAYHHSELGESDEAREQFERLAVDNFAAIPRNGAWFVSMTQLAEVCSHLGDSDRAAVLYDLLLPFADRMMIVGSGVGCSGVGARSLGILATTLGRWDAAESHLRIAIETHRRLALRPWLAMSLVDYARMLAVRGTSSLDERGRVALAEAGEIADQLGMAGLAAKVAVLPAVASGGDAAAPVVADRRGGDECVFRCEGDFWTVAFAGDVCRLKDALGMRYLVHLLRHPGRPFHATELLGLAAGARTETTAPGGLRVRSRSDALPALDERARSAYRARLLELEEELAEAERNHDIGAAERARAERDALAHEIAGRARGNSAGERARGSITKRLKATLGKIHTVHPELARHLTATVRTGYFCSYTPDPRHPIDWQT